MSLDNEELEPLEGTALDTLGEGGAEDDDSDMMAGYAQAGGGSGVDTVASKPQEDAQAAPAGASAAGASAAAPAAPAKPAAAPGSAAAAPAATPAPARIGRWTEDEVAARFAELDSLKKGQSTVAGHIGELRQRIEKSGQSKTLTAADLPGVVEEFGEQYATALAADLNKLGGFGSASGPSQTEIDTLVNARAEQYTQNLERKLEKKAVLRAHKDADDHFSTMNADGQTWTHGPKAAAFKGWVGSLPQDRQALIANSWDSDVMIQALADFKEFEKKATAAAPVAAPVATARQSRVDRATTPRGSGGAAPIVEDDLAAGYNSAKGKR
jgi:hypothetical protein